MRFLGKSTSGKKIEKKQNNSWLNGAADFLRPADESATEGNHYFFLRIVDDLKEDYDVKPVNRWEIIKHKLGMK